MKKLAACALGLCLCVAAVGSSLSQPPASLEDLQNRIQEHFAGGRWVEALPLAMELVRRTIERNGSESKDHVTALVLLSEAEVWASQLDKAGAHLLEARSLLERLGLANDKLMANVVGLQGLRAKYAGNLSEAESLYLGAIDIGTRAHGRRTTDVAADLNNLAELYREQGRYQEGEDLHREALHIREELFGVESPEVAESLNNLGLLYQNAGRLDLAEETLSRAVALRRRLLAPDNPRLATALNNLALVRKGRSDNQGALTLFEEALTIWRKAFPPDHPRIGIGLHNMADTLANLERHQEATDRFTHAITIFERAYGSGHPNTATAINNLARVLSRQGRWREAISAYRRSLEIWHKTAGPDHPRATVAIFNLAEALRDSGDLDAALIHYEQSTDNTIAAVRRERISDQDAVSAFRSHRARFESHISLAYRLIQERGESQKLAEDGFTIAQWATFSAASLALGQTAIRFAAKEPGVSELVRERQDLVREWHTRNKTLLDFISKPPAGRQPALEGETRARLGAIDRAIERIDDSLSETLKAYKGLVDLRPTSIEAVKAALQQDEALVVLLDTTGREDASGEIFVWVVTKSEVRWLRSELGTAALQREVAALRCGLDVTAWDDQGARRCAELLKLPPGTGPKAIDPLPFDAARAHALYVSLLGGARNLIAGKHLLVVPSGALTTLPFQVLVTEVPASSDLTKAPWLIRDHAITVLPSVASLVALRRTARPSAAHKSMLGFANPLLDGNPRESKDRKLAKDARALAGCATAPEQRTATRRGIRPSAEPVPQVGGLADLAHLKGQTPLPETAEEVCEVARAIGADLSDMRIGARATETEIRRLNDAGDLAHYRILHFATHGLLAGEILGTREPGLILTPPTKATPQDDGYLSASEIAGLKLDADWVILSACNTAGGAGEGEAAEALSGLARMFFYAGARALLVSHWEVDSHAAVKLITTAVGAMAKDKGLGRAEALRRAMLAAMADTSRPADWPPAWHPSVWAPLVVVGEGAASSQNGQ